MKKIAAYPGFLDFVIVVFFICLFSGAEIFVIVFYMFFSLMFRMAFYVVFSDLNLRVSEGRMMIKLLLFLMPIPYVFLRLPIVDWRTIIALYITISTVFEFVFLLLKFYCVRRFK